MAEYADECGNAVSDAALEGCYADHGRDGTTDEDQDACAEFSEDLRDEWSCDDLADYFD